MAINPYKYKENYNFFLYVHICLFTLWLVNLRMSNRISASVGDHPCPDPCFLTFYNYKYKEKFVILVDNLIHNLVR